MNPRHVAVAVQEVVRETTGVPVERQRLWLVVKRENDTMRVEQVRGSLRSLVGGVR